MKRRAGYALGVLATVSGLSRSFGQLAAGLDPFRAEGLHSAMFIVPAIAAVLAVVLFAASRAVRNDVGRLRAWMSTAA
jgi:hypothetical protein